MEIAHHNSPQVDRRTLGTMVLRWTPRVAVSAWAGFWGWFVLVDGTSHVREGLAGTIPIMGAWFAALATLTALVWIWPRVGGALMLAAGIGAAVYFANPGARLLLALPAVLIGVSSLAAGQCGRRP